MEPGVVSNLIQLYLQNLHLFLLTSQFGFQDPYPVHTLSKRGRMIE
jgi:hypothetical protein